MLSQACCEVALGVFKTSGVADGVPGKGVSVIRGVLVTFGVSSASGVLVAVGGGGAASAVSVCMARAVSAIWVKTESESTVGVTDVPPPQAVRVSREKAIKSQDIFVRYFILVLQFGKFTKSDITL
jgi:hypothetical protein